MPTAFKPLPRNDHFSHMTPERYQAWLDDCYPENGRALLYLRGLGTKDRGVYVVSIHDAIRFCHDDRAAGRSWMFQWVSEATHYELYDKPAFDAIKLIKSTGAQDEMIAELGIEILRSA